MDLIQFPFVRLQYPVIKNPLFSGDIVAANQQVLAALTAIAGLGATDFAIFGGFEYQVAVSGANTYTAGIFYLNGVWYYQPAQFSEGEYLLPNVQQIMPEVFPDSSLKNIYQVNQSLAQNASTPATTPQFVGNMNAYRMDLKTISEAIAAINFQIAVQNVQVPNLTGTYTINFLNDKFIFCASTTGNILITFDPTNAVPGTVVRLKFTFGAGQTIGILTPSGMIAYLESGNLSNAASNVNVMYFEYAGLNELNLKEVSYNISQI